jgi:hypothetical protein
MPLWILSALAGHIDRLQAEEALRFATAIQMPWMEKYQRRRIWRRWERLANPPRPKAPPEIVEVDPEKARAYFEKMGAIVVEREEP